ncbi:HNH endonuclease [Salmonella enterica subsp. enterica serovar Senftenberg]|nr:HNH endonuclease [Salmonella enterica subsp. enterica serovar Senftenberg]
MLPRRARHRSLRPCGSTQAIGDGSHHVTPWSKGAGTDLDNCEMLCLRHNRAKGNR